MLRRRPTALAKSGSMWIGLKSPEAPAYRLVRYLSGVTRSSGTASPALKSAISNPPDDVGPGAAHDLGAGPVHRSRLEDVEPIPEFLLDRDAFRGRRDLIARAR